jgi:UDP-glucose 4-epimerase
VLNCGYGHGFSVRQVVDTVASVTGRNLPIRESPRRPGDVAEIIADSSRLQAQLGWKPIYNDLQQIVSTAFAWERRLNSA